MSARLAERTALVTGSTRGIGRAIVQRLAAEGAVVVVHGTSDETASAVAEGITVRGGRAVAVHGDFAADATAGERVARAALDACGGALDIVVNNAALMTGAISTAESDGDLVERALRVSVAAPIAITRICVAGMIARRRGVIINVGSVNGAIGMADFALYGATKGALHSLTRAWASEFGAHGVRVNTVAPGPTYTERNGTGPGRARIDALMRGAPSGRPVSSEQVADAVAFLASDEASGVTGTSLFVDGGYTAV